MDKMKDKTKVGLAILIFIGVIALGALAVNQTLGYIYKSQFLQTPCTLCVELNPHLEECFTEESNYVANDTLEFNDSSILLRYSV